MTVGRLALEPALEVADVAAEDFVAYSDDRSAVNEAVLATCRAAGFSPIVSHRAPSTAALLALVGARLGVALVPESVRSMQLAGVVFRDIAGAHAIDLSLAWLSAGMSPLVAGALDVLEDQGFFEPERPRTPTPQEQA